MRRAEAVIANVGPPSAAQLWGRFVGHVRVPLHRDGYALALNSAFTAATGLVYWILAAKTFSVRDVGLNYALISAMTFLSGIASLNLPNILVRFLPESGRQTRVRVVVAYGVAATFAAAAAIVFIVGVGAFSPRLGFLRSDRSLDLWFVFSTLAWCVFVIQDSVLTALRRAVWVPIENAVFSVLKIALLVAIAAAIPRYGIFVSWTIAMLVSVAGVNFLIFTRLLRRMRLGPSKPVQVRDRAFARYFAADYTCAVSWLAITSLTPLVITAAAGATTNAYWALAFSVAFPMYLISQNIGTSLMLHGTGARARLPAQVRKAAIQGAWVLVPSVTLLVLLAPYVLSLFGASYAEHATTVLRLLALGALPNFVVALAVFTARVQRRLRRAVIALAADALITLGLAVPLIHALGVTGVGLGWVFAQTVVALGVLLPWRRSLQPEASGIAPPPQIRRDQHRVVEPAGRKPIDVEPAEIGQPHPVLGALFAALERQGLRWLLLRLPSNLAAPTGDVDLLVAGGDCAALVQVARELGFVSLPGWESPPHVMLVRYDRSSNHWLVLDVTTQVSFRSPRGWRLPDAAEQILARRQLLGGIALPANGDAFWLLLLHCLLDKGVVALHYLDRLRRLAIAGPGSPLEGALYEAAGEAFAARDFIDAGRAGDADALMHLGVELEAALRRRRPVAQRLRALGTATARATRRPLLVRRRRGVSLVLLGPNGAGKSTAAARLERSLPFEVRVVYMGMWKAQDKPRGRVAAGIEIAIRPLRVWCRYLLAQCHQLRGRMVVFDRYVYDALLPPSPPFLAAKRAYFLLLAHTLPRPHAAVFLDVPGDVAFGRKAEDSPQNLESERRLYGELTRRSFPVQRIDATADASAVEEHIATILWRELTLRWHGASAEA